MYKIIGTDGKEYGPVSIEQLRQWIAEGRVNAQTRVLPEGGAEWQVISSLPEFAGSFTGAPALPGPLPSMGPLPVNAPAVVDQVNGPAIGLIVTAVLGFLVQVASLIMNLAGASIMSMQHGGGPQAPWAAMFSGTFAIVTSLIGIIVSGVVLVAALKMKKLENYGLAMAGSIIAAIPCISPCCLIGLPIGIWAIVVLMKPEVKNSFH
jgi:hypothetical protein